jgi:hypothetical protein
MLNLIIDNPRLKRNLCVRARNEKREFFHGGNFFRVFRYCSLRMRSAAGTCQKRSMTSKERKSIHQNQMHMFTLVSFCRKGRTPSAFSADDLSGPCVIIFRMRLVSTAFDHSLGFISLTRQTTMNVHLICEERRR